MDTSYNWEEIFESKTDEELYEIFLGNSMLPDSTIPFAEKELKRRNFDFNHIELEKEKWKLLSMEDDITDMRLEILRRDPVTLKGFLIMIVIFIVTIIMIGLYAKMSISNIILFNTLTILFASLTFLLERFVYKKRVQYLQKKIEKKSMLINSLSEQITFNEQKQLSKKLSEQTEVRIKEIKATNKVLGIIMTIVFILYLIFKFLI